MHMSALVVLSHFVSATDNTVQFCVLVLFENSIFFCSFLLFKNIYLLSLSFSV